ncbi:hypothetical protein CQA53_10190, partial [Helicobacter didelphidarum]
MPNKLYQKYYTLGVYVDTWGWNEGVIPHVFLGLKVEYQLINENFNGTLDDKSRKQYAVESKLEKHSKTTQMELIEKLTREFKHNEANKEKWIEQKDEAIYEELDEDYLFFRQGYK